MVAVACGSDATGATDPTAPTPPPPATFPSFPGIAAALNIDANHLPNYLAPLPAYYAAAVTSTDNTPANNPLTNAGASLGRDLLFYRPPIGVDG